MLIGNSLEWAAIDTEFRTKINTRVKNMVMNQQLHMMVNNISRHVSELSKAEVLARRGKGESARILLEKINNEINEVSEFLLLAAIMTNHA